MSLNEWEVNFLDEVKNKSDQYRVLCIASSGYNKNQMLSKFEKVEEI